MTDNEDLELEDFIPEPEESDTAEVDIHELLFCELTQLLNPKKNTENQAVTYWLIGDRLRRTLGVIQDARKGQKAFKGLQKQIADRFGNEYTEQKLYDCLTLADEFPDLGIFSEYTDRLTLNHFLLILNVESDMARTFYCEMCKHNKWSVEELKTQINAGAFETEYGE